MLEKMLISIMERAKLLIRNGETLNAPAHLKLFLKNDIEYRNFVSDKKLFQAFILLDDYDIWTAVKEWTQHPDKVLSTLCQDLLFRKLFRTNLAPSQFPKVQVQKLKKKVKSQFQLNDSEADFFILTGTISNAAYIEKGEKIN